MGTYHPVVLRAGHFQIRQHVLDLGVADVAAVQEGQQVEDGEHGDEAEVHLAQDLLAVDVAEVDVGAGEFGIMMQVVAVAVVVATLFRRRGRRH